MDWNDVRVGELRGHSRLAKKALSHLGHVGEHPRKDLDRDRPLELDVHAQVHDSHPAAADLALEHEIRDEGARACREFSAVGHRTLCCGREARRERSALTITSPARV